MGRGEDHSFSQLQFLYEGCMVVGFFRARGEPSGSSPFHSYIFCRGRYFGGRTGVFTRCLVGEWSWDFRLCLYSLSCVVPVFENGFGIEKYGSGVRAIRGAGYAGGRRSIYTMFF